MQARLFQNTTKRRYELYNVRSSKQRMEGESRPEKGRCQTWTSRRLSCRRPWKSHGQALPNDKQGMVTGSLQWATRNLAFASSWAVNNGCPIITVSTKYIKSAIFLCYGIFYIQRIQDEAIPIISGKLNFITRKERKRYLWRFLMIPC
jgi:hypothetical protein